ncbi:hypothetical protein CsatB_022861 [Cannabis sativa]|uniref:Uncharacterized protein n=2 Tax=Cannabis sativa TaxID=3483 RepID=A0A7J6IB89_CANSA|nr:uncharacterized protein LOC115711982 [Cannabis sativa]KAF4404556.1 hypothetical protein G4B88_005942 [Cannabis sativa]
MMGEEQGKSFKCGRLSRCFSSRGVHHHHEVLGNNNDYRASSFRTRTWLKSTANDLPEIRERCRNLIQRWKIRRHNNQPFQSSDFSYDLSSYSLNFEDDNSRFDDDEFRLKDFSSRLPASPSTPTLPPASSAAKCGSDSGGFGRGLIVGF